VVPLVPRCTTGYFRAPLRGKDCAGGWDFIAIGIAIEF